MSTRCVKCWQNIVVGLTPACGRNAIQVEGRGTPKTKERSPDTLSVYRAPINSFNRLENSVYGTSLLLSLHQPFRVSAALNARAATSDPILNDDCSRVELTASKSIEGY